MLAIVSAIAFIPEQQGLLLFGVVSLAVLLLVYLARLLWGRKVAESTTAAPGFNKVLTLCSPLSITGKDLSFMAETLEGSFEQPKKVEKPVRPSVD